MEIVPELIGKPKDGFKIARIELIPSKAFVRGPESKINPKDRIRTTPIDITGLAPPSPPDIQGAVSNWNPANNYGFIIATASGGISGFAVNKFTLVDTNFANNNSYYDNASFWRVYQTGNSVVLAYNTPEPSALALLALGGLTLLRRRRR